MATVTWDNSLAASNLLTTELNSLGDTAAAITATAFDVDTSHPTHADMELLVTYGSSPAAGLTVDLYIIRTLDASNWEDGSTSGPVVPANGFLGSFVLAATTSAQRLTISKIELPPMDPKFLVVNNAGVSTAASGNVLAIKPYRWTVA